MLKINNLNDYQNQNIIKNFNYNFSKTTTIIGKSGCGKTTLLKSIILNNPNIKFSYLDQENNLLHWLNVYDNLNIINIEFNLNIDINYYLKLFDLYHLKDKHINDLSGGEKKRIAILRTFLIPTDFILLDEPLNNLDEINKKIIVDFINYFKKNKTIIVVSHDIYNSFLYSDYILTINKPFAIINKYDQNNFNFKHILKDIS